MSMYDLALGDGNQAQRGAILLTLLGRPETGRYRDAWVETDPDTGDPIIAVYTRNGGSYRDCYCDDGALVGDDHHTGCLAKINAELTAHPAYLGDADDEFDSTYATFYFAVTDPEVRDALRPHATPPVDSSARWHAAIERLTP